MAIRGSVITKFGEERECYIRINNVENAANHNVKWKPRLRGYLIDFTVEESPAYVWDSIEEGIEISCNIDVSLQKSVWTQMYEQIKIDSIFLSKVTKTVDVI